MPSRRRAQEAKRTLRKVNVAVERAEAEIRAQEALLSADPLDDVFWRDHEDPGPHDPDDDCYFYCPHEHWQAREEIDAYLNRSAG